MKHDTLPKTIIPFVWHFLKPYKIYLAGFVVCAVISGLFNIIFSTLLKIIVDTIDFNTATSSHATLSLKSLFWPSIGFVINFEIHNTTWRLMNCINYKVQPLVKNAIIQETFNYIIRHSHQFFQDHMSGKLSNNITILANSIERAVHDLSRHIIRGAVMVCATFITLYLVHPDFFWCFLIWAFLFGVGSFWASRKSVLFVDYLASTESAVSGNLVDSISNAQNIRYFSMFSFESSYLLKTLSAMRLAFRRKEKFMIIYWSLQGISQTAMLAVMVHLLVNLRQKNLVSAGDFALILTLCTEVGFIVWWTMEQIDNLNDMIGKCNQSLRSLFVPLEITDVKNALDLTVTHGKIQFEHVYFHYKNAADLFENQSVTIAPGQKVGLVGYSGGGKTTFVSLILRLYDVNNGRILIDGQDIAAVTQDSLRTHIGMIPQDSSLFHRTLMENIRYGRADATDEEVVDAAKRAHAHDFIEQLPEGYASLVGERGIKLSGGQRQRIAIARAMLKNAPILILDEATSALDSVTEHVIQEAITDLMQGKTSLVIAHRLSTLLHMDRILVFDKGKIVEDGAHHELLAKAGLYKTLWDAQVGGFLGDGETVSS